MHCRCKHCGEPIGLDLIRAMYDEDYDPQKCTEVEHEFIYEDEKEQIT